MPLLHEKVPFSLAFRHSVLNSKSEWSSYFVKRVNIMTI